RAMRTRGAGRLTHLRSGPERRRVGRGEAAPQGGHPAVVSRGEPRNRSAVLVEALDPGIVPGPARVEQKSVVFVLDARHLRRRGTSLCLDAVEIPCLGV